MFLFLFFKDLFAEEAICSYCVLGSVDEPKYVAAITDKDMECKVSCDKNATPQCSCYNKEFSYLVM